jgi:nanoRNase/pAp phosphatase (c-di-AMP/oligoRNAs hydrolase)
LARPPDAAEKRLEQLAQHLHGKRRLLIVTHDNPDPDTIATGWALLRLARRLRRMRVDLAYGGIIGRGENRALLEVLKVPLQRLEELDPVSYDAIALVDSQPGTGNNSLPPGTVPTIVIDHHPMRRGTRDVPFHDVREDYGASVTIASEYLFAAGMRIDRRLATAIFYAIKAETRNLGREASHADIKVFLELFPLVDNHALSQIEHPPIPRTYFSMIDQAIDGTRLHGCVAVTRSGELSSPDVVAEFADLMVRLEGIRWSFAVGRYGPDLWLSIRTNLERANAGRMVRRVVGNLGVAGGHGMMAGGKIPDGAATPAKAMELEEILCTRALSLLRAEQAGIPLVEVNGVVRRPFPALPPCPRRGASPRRGPGPRTEASPRKGVSPP